MQVTPKGEYKPPPPSNAKASYATMVYVRATIVEGAGWALARSVTIAVSSTSTARYECFIHLYCRGCHYKADTAQQYEGSSF